MRSHRVGMPRWQVRAAWSTLGIVCCALSALVASQGHARGHVAPSVTVQSTRTATTFDVGPTSTGTITVPGARTTLTAKSTTTDTATTTATNTVRSTATATATRVSLGPTATVTRPGPTVTVTKPGPTVTVTETETPHD